MVHFVVDNVLSTAGLVLGVAVVGVTARMAVPVGVRTSIADQPGALQFGEAFMIAALAGYGAHRMAHRVPLLWRFHKVHHAITEMDWLAAGHLHPVDQAIQRTCVVAALFALGFSKATFGTYLVVAAFQAIFIHANMRLTSALRDARWPAADRVAIGGRRSAVGEDGPTGRRKTLR